MYYWLEILFALSEYLIWFDNRLQYDQKWLYKDSYYGVNNLRVSILPNGSLQMVTWFYLGNVRLHKVNPSDLSAINLFVDNLSSSDILIVRYMFEFSLSSSFISASLFFGNLISERIRCRIHKYLHICDTHHGISPISSAIRFANILNPDSLSCNQVHHLHFFRRPSFLNLPRVSIDNVSVYEALSSKLKKLNTESPIYFPASLNNIHIKRYSYFSKIASNPLFAAHLSNKRFDHYPDWLFHVSIARAFIYVPLASSIGLNNIIPAAITNTKILAYQLPVPTSQNYLYSYLGARVSYFKSPDELMQLILDSPSPSSSQHINSFIYRKALPTPKHFINSIVNYSGELFGQLRPSNLDSRYNELCQLAEELSEDQFLDFVHFYEHLQFLFERLDKILFIFPRPFTSTANSISFRYLKLLVQDICSFQYLSLDQVQNTYPTGSQLLFCIMNCHLEMIPELFNFIPAGSFLLTPEINSSVHQLLSSSLQLENPFESSSVTSIFQKKSIQ